MKNEIATFAGGCFWCTEALYEQLKGVHTVISGYAGGTTKNPTYEQVSSGVTGHAECIQVTFDPQIISFETLLDIFWHTHNPTTRNQQGNDIGTQYRSVIFYHDEKQKQIAEASKGALEKEGLYADPIVTEIVPFQSFYPAEDYHKQYYRNNKNAPYCQVVIYPKLQKFLKRYHKEVKE